MGITIREFEVAMETYGAERLTNRLSSPYITPEPCFNVAGTHFFHSSTSGPYVALREKKVPEETMNRAMAEFGENPVEHFWCGDIYSIQGLLTLALMLDRKYSKKLVDELTNETYKKLFNCCSYMPDNVDFHFHSINSSKIEKLYKLLAEYDNIVNPFGNKEILLNEPTQYLDAVNVSLAMKEGKYYFKVLTLDTNTAETTFCDSWKGWSYSSCVLLQRRYTNRYIKITHSYRNRRNKYHDNEFICLFHKVNAGNDVYDPDNIDLTINLRTGMAWKAYGKKQPKPVTDDQIDVIIDHLNIMIQKLKNKIVQNMINV